jgi:hypothetical protein
MTQSMMEVLRSTDETRDLSTDFSLPLKSISEVNEWERKLEDAQIACKR